MSSPERLVCPRCGDTDILFDAWAAQTEEGTYELAEVMDAIFCKECDCESSHAVSPTPEAK